MAINFSDSILKNRLLTVFYLFAAKSGDFVEPAVFMEHFEERGVVQHLTLLAAVFLANYS